ncbi:olfactory receptor 51G2-like [Protobothrops mucrosquamatus]|uniref:olfactory receptor 51G2-like n=1 Tax=Protobothrops mucrosquamatus TaxID=103944 RepID=UPI0007755E6A|nr:olfactory receptor 51G2-like [Protobothrops mucrosquamatus]
MAPLRNQSAPSPTFFLVGIRGLEARSPWASLPFCFLYAIALLGNSAILLAIVKDRNLHKPMYLFLSMLAVSELGVSLSTLPTVLGVFLFGVQEIGLDACLSQMFFIHCFSIMDSGVLWAMALDRFVAIYNPLRYASILTGHRIALIGSGIALRSAVPMIPLVFLLRKLPFCKSRSHLLAHPYCLHPNLIRIPCADTTLNNRVGLFVVVITFGIDSLCIVLSYVLIFRTVLSISSREGRLKALNTCVSHICAVVVYYTPMVGLSMVHRFSKRASPLVPSLLAHIYLLVPPALNPIIYSIKTKEIRKTLSKFLACKKS